MNESGKAGLHWTFHPIIDVGVAALTAFAEKDSPETDILRSTQMPEYD